MDHAAAPALFSGDPGAPSGGMLFELSSESAVVSSEEQRWRAGKRLIDKLLIIRRELDAIQKEEFFTHVDNLIRTIRACCECSDDKRVELILYSIEVQGASTATEIAEDTRLLNTKVQELLDVQEAKGVVYKTRRHVPGSDRPQYMYKSTRAAVPEATATPFDESSDYYAQWSKIFD